MDSPTLTSPVLEDLSVLDPELQNPSATHPPLSLRRLPTLAFLT